VSRSLRVCIFSLTHVSVGLQYLDGVLSNGPQSFPAFLYLQEEYDAWKEPAVPEDELDDENFIPHDLAGFCKGELLVRVRATPPVQLLADRRQCYRYLITGKASVYNLMETPVVQKGKRPLSERLGITSVSIESIAWTAIVVSSLFCRG
jgi:hypothetical protein